jgi:hypothetical protein
VRQQRADQLSMHEKPGMREVMLKTNLKGKYDDSVNVVRKRGNMEQADQLNNENNAAVHIEDLKLYYYQYSTEKRDMVVYLIDAVMLNKEYEAGIEVRHGRKHNIYEKPKMRDVMDDITDDVMINKEYEADVKIKTNPKGKYDKNVNVMDGIIMLNTEYEAGIKVYRGRELYVYKKPKMREVMLETDLKSKYEKPKTRDGMLKTTPKGKYDEDGYVNNMMNMNNAAVSIEDSNKYQDNYYQYSSI